MKTVLTILAVTLLGGCELTEVESTLGIVAAVFFGGVVPLASVIVRLTPTKRDDLILGKILPFLSILDPDKGTKLPLTPANKPVE